MIYVHTALLAVIQRIQFHPAALSEHQDLNITIRVQKLAMDYLWVTENELREPLYIFYAYVVV